MCVIYRPHGGSHLIGQSFPLLHTAGMQQKGSGFRRSHSFLQSGSAGSQIIGPNTSHLRCDIKMSHREFAYF
jgi:hypothetical protein